MKDYIKKIISFDEVYAPFEIIDLEGDKNSGYYKNINLPNNKTVKISGIVDRVDKKIIYTELLIIKQVEIQKE